MLSRNTPIRERDTQSSQPPPAAALPGSWSRPGPGTPAGTLPSQPGIAAAYLRKSTDEEGRQESSLSDQLREIRRYCERTGLTLREDAIVHESISGGASLRRGFDAMMHRLLSGGGIGHLVVWRLDRFSRESPLDALEHYRALLKEGVSIHSVAEGKVIRDPRDVGELVTLVVSASQNHEYLRGLSANVYRGFLGKIETARIRAGAGRGRRGWPIGRIPPWGYDVVYHDAAGEPYQVVRFELDRSKSILDLQGQVVRSVRALVGEDGEKHFPKVMRGEGELSGLIPGDPQRILAVTLAYDSFTKGGLGTKQIARLLNEKGFPSPRGYRWGHQSIRNILRRPEYAGITSFNRVRRGKYHRITAEGIVPAREEINPKTGTPFNRRRNIAEDVILVPGTHEALVLSEQWEEAQRIRERRKTVCISGSGQKAAYVLSSLVQCCMGDCKNLNQPRFVGVTLKKRVYYRCNGYAYGFGCPANQFPEHKLLGPIKRIIAERIRSHLGEGGSGCLDREIALELSRRDAEEAGHLERRRLTARLAEVESKIEVILHRLDADLMDLANDRLKKLKEEKEWLQAKLAFLGPRPARKAAAAPVNSLGQVRKYLEDLSALFETGDPREVREVIRGFVGWIRVYPEKGMARVGFFPTETVLEAAVPAYQSGGVPPREQAPIDKADLRPVYQSGGVPPRGVEPLSPG